MFWFGQNKNLFGPKINMSTKSFIEYILGKKKIWPKKIFGSKKIWYREIFWVKNQILVKNILVKKISGQK